MPESTMRFNTRAIHVGQHPDPVTGAVITPLYQTTTYAQEDAGIHKGYDYTRCANPTQTVLEQVLASLEKGRHGFCFSSGVGALSTLCFTFFKPGDHLLVGDDVYGGTFRFLTKVFSHYGIQADFIDMTDLATLKAAIRPNTKMIYMETPTNPLLKLVDIEAVVALAKQHNLLTCVDNTFATPYIQQPLTMGVDIILQSTTKYIGGHSDVIGGALILKDDTFKDEIFFHRKTLGATPDPFACWLTLRGVKTLGLRMEAHCASAQRIAEFLAGHPAVEEVIYPGLASHPQHELAKKQMNAAGKPMFGGMISLRLCGGGEAEARRFMKSLKLFALAESLGGVESLVEHPAIMTHASVDKPIREARGITDSLVRLSVGVEHVDDLLEDLDMALNYVATTCREHVPAH